MTTSFSAGRSILLCVAFAGLAVFGVSCGRDSTTNAGSQDSPGFGVAGESAGSGLAVAGFQFVATQALEEQCDQGQSSACKIAFAVDPLYQQGKTQQQINDTLAAMDKELQQIKTELVAIEDMLDRLAQQLNIAVADLKLDTGNETAKQYMLNVVNAYNYFEKLDYSDKKAVDTPLIVSSILTNDASSNPYDVPANLDKIHGLIVDDVVGPGLLSKMDDLMKARIDAIWAKGTPPSYYDAINHYELMEQYFGYLLMQQAKGIVVISACYKYLDKFPDARIPGQPTTILDRLIYKTFDAYYENYARSLEDQIETFLKHVENYIAYTADVDKPGADSGMAADGSNTDIQGWTSVVLKRADLMAAWARASLKKQAAGTPVLLAVRVLGEPDRSKLLYGSGTIRDVQTGKPYAIDKAFLKLVQDQPEEYRILAARRPYMQFPVHLDKAQGTVERDGALKGANSFIMNKYILTDTDGVTGKDGDKRTVGVPEWVGTVDTSYVKLVGPDGNIAQDGGPAMYYGHVTVVLKETAARLGIWSHGNPSDIEKKSIDNLTKTAEGKDSFPQSVQLYVYADPHASKTGECAGGECWTRYSLNGDGYFKEQLMGEYYFEGWGDVPETQTLRARPILSGKASQSVSLPASHGSYSMELHFALTNDSQSTSTNDKGDVTVAVTAADKWAPNTNIKFFVEPRIKCYWNTSRTSGSYGTSTLQGTMKFDLSSLVLQVK